MKIFLNGYVHENRTVLMLNKKNLINKEVIR